MTHTYIIPLLQYSLTMLKTSNIAVNIEKKYVQIRNNLEKKYIYKSNKKYKYIIT